METAYLICATLGGTILLVQTLMLVFGGSADSTDADHMEVHDAHASGEGFLKMLSLKTLVAFVTFFGLAGLASQRAGMSPGPALVIGAGAGLIALWVVAWLMALLVQLHAQGNVQLENAVGKEGVVYLRIPARATGPGKVTVEVQNRTLEYDAITRGDEIPTGARVRITALRDAETLEVSSLNQE